MNTPLNMQIPADPPFQDTCDKQLPLEAFSLFVIV
jgi:hypothetical protein